MKILKQIVIVLVIASILQACNEKPKQMVTAEKIACDAYETPNSYVLKDRGEGVDYIVDCKLRILGDLKIEPGVTIAFKNDAGFQVESTGSLNATGEAKNKITFQGEDNIKGSWLGIYYDSDDVKNQLIYCDIVNAGGNAFNSNGDKGAVIVWADTKLKISDCNITNSAAYGINAIYRNAKVSMVNNTISNCDIPMYLLPEYVGYVEQGTYTGNKTDVVLINTYIGNNSIETAQTWNDLEVPYRTKPDGKIIVDEVHFQISEGVTIEFATNSGIQVNKEASFAAKGTELKPILFTGVVKQAGSWANIEYRFTNSPLNELTHTNIEYAGESSENGALYMWSDPDVKVSNVNFSNIEACAIYDAPKPNFDPTSQVENPNLVLQNVTYTSISNQNSSTILAGNASYCFGN